jgi:hypothetical protein
MGKQTIKIGKGFYQNGYGRGFKKEPIIRLINGKAYAKCSTATPFQTDLEGYIMVNAFVTGSGISFVECGIISQHQEYRKLI